MAIMYPTEITKIHGEVSSAERNVFRKLKGLPCGYHVVWSFCWVDRYRQGEADFVIVHPRRPHFLVLEVKGNSVKFEGNQWFQMTTDDAWEPINPVDQARNSMWLISRRLKGKGLEPWGDIALILPDARVEAGLEEEIGGIRYANIIDSHRCNALGDAIGAIFEDFPDKRDAPAGVEPILDVVRPKREFAVTLASRMRQEREAWKRLTEEQVNVLDLFFSHNRVIVSGVAGSGKTILAMEAARRAALPDEVSALFLCWNYPLGREVYSQLISATRVNTYSFNLLCEDVKNKYGDLDNLPENERWDAVFIDEAQDFNAELWEDLKKLLKSWENGKIWLFHDPHQDVRQDRGAETIVDVAIQNDWFQLDHMDKNIRNTQRIGEYASDFIDGNMRFPPGSPLGLPVLAESATTPVDIARSILSRVCTWVEKNDMKENRIAVLEADHPRSGDSTINGAKKVIREKLCGGQDNSIPLLIDTHRKADVKLPRRLRDLSRPAYSSTGRFKGLEADGILLVTPLDPRLANVEHEIYVGASRAQHKLVVLSVPLDYCYLCHAFWTCYVEAFGNFARSPAVPQQAWREVAVRCGKVVVFVSLGVEPGGVHIFIRGAIDESNTGEVEGFVRKHKNDLEAALEEKAGNGPRFFVHRKQYDMQNSANWPEAGRYLREKYEEYVLSLQLLEDDTTVLKKDDGELDGNRRAVRGALCGLFWGNKEETDGVCERMRARGIDGNTVRQEIEELLLESSSAAMGEIDRDSEIRRYKKTVGKIAAKRKGKLFALCQKVAKAVQSGDGIEGVDTQFKAVRDRVCEKLDVLELDTFRFRVLKEAFASVFPGSAPRRDGEEHL